MTHVNPSLDQDSFRGRNDDGSESAATWKATANTNWTQAVDTNFRVRFLVQETAGGTENNGTIQLQYNLNGAGWNSVNGTSSVVQSSASTNFADDDNTTQQIGAGTFITPNSGMDEDNGLAGELNDIDFAGNDEVEVEYCCQILSADVADADTVQLRVVRGDLTVLETYTNTPSVTVSESSSQIINVGLATEADSALVVSAAKALTVGLATETDSAFAVSASKGKAVGLASETDTAFAVGKAKARTVGLVQETDTALAVSAGGEQIIVVGLASEADSAFAVTVAKQAAAGLAQETDTASLAGRKKSLGIVQALESDTSLVLGAAKAKALGLATETDSSLGIGRAKALTLGLALETDTAFPLEAENAARGRVFKIKCSLGL